MARPIKMGASPSRFQDCVLHLRALGIDLQQIKLLSLLPEAIQAFFQRPGLILNEGDRDRVGRARALGFFFGPGRAETAQSLDYLLFGSAPKLEDEKRITDRTAQLRDNRPQLCACRGWTNPDRSNPFSDPLPSWEREICHSRKMLPRCVCGISPESRRAENTALEAMAAMAFSHSSGDRGDSFIDTS